MPSKLKATDVVRRFLEFQLSRAFALYDEMFNKEFRFNPDARTLFQDLSDVYLGETSTFLRVALETDGFTGKTRLVRARVSLIAEFRRFRNVVRGVAAIASDGCEIGVEFQADAQIARNSLDTLSSLSSQLLSGLGSEF